MANPDSHVGDVGTRIACTFKDQDGAVVDISAASTRSLKIRRGDGTQVTRTLTLTGDGTDGVAHYDTVAADLTVPGLYTYQGTVVIAARTWHSDKHKRAVLPVLAGA